jgi:hypothetical protein
MRLSIGNKRQSNHNGRMESPRLQRKRGRASERNQKATTQASLPDSQRDTNVSRHSGNVIREHGEEVFVAAENQG